MATYVMSDIHGQLEKFNELLEKINFSTEDRLILLGDYVDGGTRSAELLIKLMHMASTQNVQCLIGNHDKMMLDVMLMVHELMEDKGTPSNKSRNQEAHLADSWFSNGGYKTYEDLMKISSNQRKEIVNWVTKLEYTKQLTVSNKNYYLCHSFPRLQGTEDDEIIWRRMNTSENIERFRLEFPDTILISGHTIVNSMKSYRDSGPHMKIHKDSSGVYINIDCGGKSMGRNPESALAALRLDDGQETYVKF